MNNYSTYCNMSATDLIVTICLDCTYPNVLTYLITVGLLVRI